MDLSGVAWRKASRSTENGGNCVELAPVNGLIAIRDSKDPSGPKLLVNRKDFRRFVETLENP
ncbi:MULTISPECIES: DUF397 domain-containing protein [unclassified Spirillospora]|uniref:DUF397 domain-containing protein n=1 Tax=unclassified Spirillospora TaxID=2642701 RepID=UPI003712DB08